jgi:hypothetical protein
MKGGSRVIVGQTVSHPHLAQNGRIIGNFPDATLSQGIGAAFRNTSRSPSGSESEVGPLWRHCRLDAMTQIMPLPQVFLIPRPGYKLNGGSRLHNIQRKLYAGSAATLPAFAVHESVR